MSDLSRYDGRTPEPPYECPDCREKDGQIAVLTARVQELEERVDLARVYVIPDLLWGEIIIRLERTEPVWFIWNKDMNRHLDRDGSWWDCTHESKYWEYSRFDTADEAFIALARWKERER